MARLRVLPGREVCRILVAHGFVEVRRYNARPQRLADAHNALDFAVAAAYGWDAGISEMMYSANC